MSEIIRIINVIEFKLGQFQTYIAIHNKIDDLRARIINTVLVSALDTESTT
jgi:hypothetical protein